MIPTKLHVVEFCMFVEDRNKHSTVFSKKRDLSILKVLKGPEPNIYVIAIKLNSIDAAKRFIQEFHKRKFNQIEADLCEVFTLNSVKLFTNAQTEEVKKDSPQILFEDNQEQQNCPICLEPNDPKDHKIHGLHACSDMCTEIRKHGAEDF